MYYNNNNHATALALTTGQNSNLFYRKGQKLDPAKALEMRTKSNYHFS